MGALLWSLLLLLHEGRLSKPHITVNSNISEEGSATPSATSVPVPSLSGPSVQILDIRRSLRRSASWSRAWSFSYSW
nr:SLAM family member 9 isoform X3 [Rattus norvegicus]